MRFSLRLNNDLPLDDYRRLAVAAEDAGFDQLWVSHDLFLRSAPVLVAAMAAVTRRLSLGIGILNPYTQSPAEIAMTAATLDELSGNRFLLGLGAGAADFLEWVGIEQARPLAAVAESMAAIRALLSGETGAVHGRHLRWSEQCYLRFAAPRTTPIYLGAMGPRMLELAGRAADGALPLLFPPEHLHSVRPLIARGIAARDPELPPFDLAACVWLSLADDPAAARRPLAEKIAYYGRSLGPLILERLGLERAAFEPIHRALHRDRDLERAVALVDERMLAIGVAGDPDAVISRLSTLLDAGVRHLSFGPPLGPDPLVAVELLGRRVLPALRAAVS
ncbi:MAG TPA: LLM class flavin-dependent oxidoreductase [Thermoanaerobaculia bacterium]|nr:LLM class flavin-dependent oxidoreductase [Thermoanaerobaculia bacterium]